MALTRTTKFEIVFPGVREADRLAFYKRLWGVQEDLRRAATRLNSALFMLKQGQIERPERVRTRGKKKGQMAKVGDATLAYQAFSGKWRPFGEDQPLYAPYGDNHRAGGPVCRETAKQVVVRSKEDFAKNVRGEAALSTFRNMGITVGRKEVRFIDGRIELTVFAREHNNTRVSVRPRKLDGSRNAILRRIMDGTYKLGTATLVWDKRGKQRRGKWFLCMSYTDEGHAVMDLVPEGSSEPLVAGVDIGIQHAAWVAFAKHDGTPVKRPKVINFPGRLLRDIDRIVNDLKERSYFNRASLGIREGRGRKRKMRAVFKVQDHVSEMNMAMLRQIVAQVISECKERGATLISIEDHGRWSVDKMHEFASLQETRASAAKVRRSYFRWHQGTLRQLLKEVGEREGIRVIEVDAAWTSRTCHQCEAVHKRDWIKRKAKDGEVAAGRIELRKFACTPNGTEPVFRVEGSKLVEVEATGCGYAGHADHNAALNIARRGIEKAHDPKKWAKDKDGGSPLVQTRSRRKRRAPAAAK